MRSQAAAISYREDAVVKGGRDCTALRRALRPGATDDQVALVGKRQSRSSVAASATTSWVHLDDAASATVLALEQHAKGVFNIVDDEPAPVSEWLPQLAACAGAKVPMRVPKWLARMLAGEVGAGRPITRGSRAMGRRHR